MDDPPLGFSYPSEPLEEQFDLILRQCKEGASVDQLIVGVKRLIERAPISVASACRPGTELFRATCHHTSVPQRIDELWFPPPEKVTLVGRANRIGHSVFYASSDKKGAVSETRPTIGQMLVLSEWVTIDRMVLHDLGYSTEVLSQPGCRRGLPPHHKQLYEKRHDDNGKRIRDFIASTFVNPSKDFYRLTAAIAEMFMKSESINGICYPSISEHANADNIALNPEFVQSSLRLKSARWMQVDEIRENGSFAGNTLGELQHATISGQLEWKFTGTPTPIPPNSGISLDIGKLTHVLSGGLLECEGKRYEVKPGYSIQATESEFVVKNLRGERVAPISNIGSLT